MTICASNNHKSRENTKGLFFYDHDMLEEDVKDKREEDFFEYDEITILLAKCDVAWKLCSFKIVAFLNSYYVYFCQIPFILTFLKILVITSSIHVLT